MLTLDNKVHLMPLYRDAFFRRLREQGWPESLVRWVASFTTGRTVQIRLNGVISPSQNITCSLPQGPPISLILFMLYISPNFKLGNQQMKYGYANDVAILAISNSLAENISTLSDSLGAAIDWGEAEGITFDPAKSELQQFSRHRRDKDSRTTPPINHRGLIVSESITIPYTR